MPLLQAMIAHLSFSSHDVWGKSVCACLRLRLMSLIAVLHVVLLQVLQDKACLIDLQLLKLWFAKFKCSRVASLGGRLTHFELSNQ